VDEDIGRKRYEMTGEWRRLHNDELNDLYCSPNSIRVINSKRIRWAGNVARMGRGKVHTGFWCGDINEREHLEELGADGKIILKWIFKKWEVGM
jgi:hypothetical protein